MESQAGIKIASRNINNLRYADDNRKWRVKEENEKAGLKLSIKFSCIEQPQLHATNSDNLYFHFYCVTNIF